MPSRLSLGGLRDRLKSGNQERKHVVTSDEFLNQRYQVAFNAHPPPNPQPGYFPSNSTLTVSSQGAVAPPYSPNHVGRPQTRPTPEGVLVPELDGAKAQSTDDNQQTLYWDEQQRQALDKYHRDNVERVKQESKLKREEEKRLEAEKQRQERKRDASRESVRRVRQLIRDRYRLDLYVWNNRDVQRADRDIMMEHCIRADKALQQIYYCVNSWDSEDFTPEEWEVAKTIKELLSHQERHAIWQDVPPWDREEDDSGLSR